MMKHLVCCVLWGLIPWSSHAGDILKDTFEASSLNSPSPAAPTSTSAAYHLFSSKTWSPAPTIGLNALRFGIGATTSGHIESQARFATAPLQLANPGDYLELNVTFLNTSGLFTQGGHLGIGLYNSGGVPPLAGGMNGTATTGTTTNGGAQGWQGYVGRLAYSGGTHRLATRPAQSATTANNQDLVTEGSGSMSYTGGVSLAGSASTLTQTAGSLLTITLRLTLAAPGTLQIDNRLYLGPDTNGTLLVSQSASASGANLLTDSFDALALGWRATANTSATFIEVQSLTVTTSLPAGDPSSLVTGLSFAQQPSDANVGTFISPAVTVLATNAAGTPVTNAPITLALASGNGSLNGTTSTLTGANGLATFHDLSLTTSGTKQLRAASGTNSALSTPFVITGVAPVVTSLSPSNGAAGVCSDTLLQTTFDKPMRLQKSGLIRIFDAASPASPVDTLDLGANVDHAPSSGSSVNTATNVQPRLIGGEAFTNHPVVISGNAATIFPHAGVLALNRTYYVLVDPGVFTDTNGEAFPGIASSSDWRFTTKPAGPANSTNLVVAADGSGDFCTVQGAVDYVPSGSTTPRLVQIRNGRYVEIIHVNNRHNLTFRGQNRSNTIIAYDNNSAMNGSTHQRMVFKVNANGIALDSLTVTNSTPKGGSQAEALMVETDRKRFVAYNVNLCSYQDTILLNTSGTQCYFQDSLIQGDADFIWGGGNAFFTNCEIRSLFGGYLTQARTSPTSNGLSFVNCRLTRAGTFSSSLGRTLGNLDGNVAFVDCRIDSHITGWTDLAPRYWEFGNSNAAGTAAVSYNGTQLSPTSPDLTNARSAALWLYGWTPSLMPTLVSQPLSRVCNVGESVQFSVVATGIPSPNYKWRKNGIDLPNATNDVFAIPSAASSDAGLYSVVVSTPAGSVTSSNALLTVRVPAFPGAEGAGAYATGGRGGDVYYVTSLADSGTGTLRTGIAGAPASGRTILFKVSGNIALSSTLTVNKPNITVAGQSAPGDGICLQNNSFNVSANNVIVRHLRTRLGTNNAAEADAMWIAGGTNIIIDHVSASWSVDEVLSASGNLANLTVQWCYITESLNNSIHSKGAHGYGSLITPSVNGTLSWHHNLYAHNNSRNPRPGTDAAATVVLDFRNNVIYNYGSRAGYGSDWDPDPENLRLNYVGNYVIAGPSSSYNYAYQGGGTNTFIYQASNLIDLDKDLLFDGINNNWGMFSGTYTATNTPFDAPAMGTDPAPVALQRVLAAGGALPFQRDAADQRVTDSARRHTGQIIDAVAEVGTWPALDSISAPADSDNDGLPDYWELALELNPSLAADRNLTNNATGYTRLEDYLHWLAAPHAVADRNGSVDLNLRALNGNTTNLTFTVADGTNGAVSLLADGFTARFVPAAHFSGLAGFRYTASEPIHGVGFGPMTVGVLVSTTNSPTANTPPVLQAITNRTVIAGNPVSFTCAVSDAEAPPQLISFSLLNAPPGATLGTSSGAFYWRSTIAQSPTTNTLSVIAADNGIPSLSATQTFSITVLAPVRPALQPLLASGGQFHLSVSGDTGPDYVIQASTNLLSWSDVLTTNSPLLPLDWVDPQTGSFPYRFYRVLLGP